MNTLTALVLAMLALAHSHGYRPSARSLREVAQAVLATHVDAETTVAVLAVGWVEDRWGSIGRIPFGCGGARAIGHTIRQGAMCAASTIAHYRRECSRQVDQSGDWTTAFATYNTGPRHCTPNVYGRHVEAVRQRLIWEVVAASAAVTP